MPKQVKLEIVPSKGKYVDGHAPAHHLRLRGKNGKIVFSTEQLATKANARRIAKRLPALIAQAVIVEVD